VQEYQAVLFKVLKAVMDVRQRLLVSMQAINENHIQFYTGQQLVVALKKGITGHGEILGVTSGMYVAQPATEAFQSGDTYAWIDGNSRICLDVEKTSSSLNADFEVGAFATLLTQEMVD